jgi:hypothetical protein
MYKYTSIVRQHRTIKVSPIRIRMTITFEYESVVIIYALEKVISYARRTEQIFVAQCVW